MNPQWVEEDLGPVTASGDLYRKLCRLRSRVERKAHLFRKSIHLSGRSDLYKAYGQVLVELRELEDLARGLWMGSKDASRDVGGDSGLSARVNLMNDALGCARCKEGSVQCETHRNQRLTEVLQWCLSVEK